MIVWRTFFANVCYREYLCNILISASLGDQTFGMCADWSVWATPKESPTWPLGGEFSFKYWDYFVVQTNIFLSLILWVLFAPSATARICMCCFSYHFRPKFCLHFLGTYVEQCCLNLRHGRVFSIPASHSESSGFKSRPGNNIPVYAVWGFLCLSIVTSGVGSQGWANVELGVHFHILWTPFRCVSCWQCMYMYSLALLKFYIIITILLYVVV